MSGEPAADAPFVTCVMGTSSTGTLATAPPTTCGTRPCSATPLVIAERRIARIAMENGSFPSAGFWRPRARHASRPRPRREKHESK
jgi:hypothetical protein